MTKLRFVAGAVLVLCFCPCLMISAAESNHLIVSKISTQSGGHRIRIDKYATSRSGKHPVILVLHGAGGTLLDGPEMRRVACQLAEAGNTVYLVHYFNRTGTIFGFDSGMQKNFAVWLTTVRDCIKFAQQDNADPLPVGIYGYSLGGFLALSAAQPLAGVLRKRGATFKTRFFPEEGHVFAAFAMSRVRDDAVEFFRQHLGRK